MDVLDIANETYKHLSEQRDSIVTIICGGGIQSWEQYHLYIGDLRRITSTMEFMEDCRKDDE